MKYIIAPGSTFEYRTIAPGIGDYPMTITYTVKIVSLFAEAQVANGSIFIHSYVTVIVETPKSVGAFAPREMTADSLVKMLLNNEAKQVK